MNSSSEQSNIAASPTFAEAFRFWLKLGFISFGGPAGQIAVMHTELVERRKWVSESRFLHALNYCMLLPGPEAQQLATYIGWLLHRTWGGIVAGTLFVLPSALLLWALSLLYTTSGELKWVAAVFDGLKPAVLAIIAGAVLRIGKKSLKSGPMWSLAGLAFVAIYVFHVPFPVIVVTAGILGSIGAVYWRDAFVVGTSHADKNAPATTLLGDEDAACAHVKPTLGRALRVTGVCLTLWWFPVLALGSWFGFDHLLVDQALFFSKAAMITFGGAYAVLPYVSQQAVEYYGWLSPGQMLDGLGLAETTPGPLIMVLQFVGFLGGWKFHEPLSPLAMATLSAFITTWTTFVPCFLWIFLGAPHVEQLRGNVRLSAALSAITAAVVGVVGNLAAWFALHVMVPAGKPVNWFGILVCLLAFLVLQRFKWGIIPVVLASGALGLFYRLVA